MSASLASAARLRPPSAGSRGKAPHPVIGRQQARGPGATAGPCFPWARGGTRIAASTRDSVPRLRTGELPSQPRGGAEKDTQTAQGPPPAEHTPTHSLVPARTKLAGAVCFRRSQVTASTRRLEARPWQSSRGVQGHRPCELGPCSCSSPRRDDLRAEKVRPVPRAPRTYESQPATTRSEEPAVQEFRPEVSLVTGEGCRVGLSQNLGQSAQFRECLLFLGRGEVLLRAVGLTEERRGGDVGAVAVKGVQPRADPRVGEGASPSGRTKWTVPVSGSTPNEGRSAGASGAVCSVRRWSGPPELSRDGSASRCSSRAR